MNTKTHLSILGAALSALLTLNAVAQSPETPKKEPGTQPAKDGSSAQKPSPAQPGTGDGTLTPSKAAKDKSAQPGAGSNQPTAPAQSPEQKPQK
jgi:hypothetical protein